MVLLAFYKGYATATIAYIDPPVITAISFAPATFAVSVGATQNFTVTAVYSDGSVLDITSNAYYWISDSGNAALDGAGVIRGVGYGATTLNLYYEGQFASAPVNVI